MQDQIVKKKTYIHFLINTIQPEILIVMIIANLQNVPEIFIVMIIVNLQNVQENDLIHQIYKP